ncbi:ankyrin repeat domain-containing protein [Lysobacter koreensis]|uniref:Ankyrin repeat domain-containing protein n=1 Tax=Lysobacter koreensis TaxID=266122 RepID=A0ABW2YN01_9GAMM
MSKVIAFVVLLAASSGCAARDFFSDARDLALEIINAELDGQFCQPAPIPEHQRKAMAQALARIDRGGLSDPTGLSPLNLAVISDDIPTFKRLSTLGYSFNSPGNTLLHDAALHNSMQALPFLLASGVAPNASSSYGATALMSAAANGRVDVARALLVAGATPNAKNTDGGTALHYAIGCRNQEMVDVLLSAGAAIDPRAQSLAERHGLKLSRHER